MFNNKNKKVGLRQPKIFKSSPEAVKYIWPRFVKISIPLLIIIVVLFYIIFLSPWFKIKNIEIVGSPPEEVRNEINIHKGENIFSFQSQKIRSKLLRENRNYSDIKFYRGIPDTIKVIFNDRTPCVVWETGAKKYLVDDNAIIYKEDDIMDDSLPHVKDLGNLPVQLPSQITSVDFVSFIKQANSELNKSKFTIVDFEVSETTFQVSAVTDNNIRIIFNLLRPLSDQIDALNKVYEQSRADIKEHIDLRVEGRVYFK